MNIFKPKKDFDPSEHELAEALRDQMESATKEMFEDPKKFVPKPPKTQEELFAVQAELHQKMLSKCHKERDEAEDEIARLEKEGDNEIARLEALIDECKDKYQELVKEKHAEIETIDARIACENAWLELYVKTDSRVVEDVALPPANPVATLAKEGEAA